MKALYPLIRWTLPFAFMFVFASNGIAQCPDGHPGGATAFDTTIAFGTGITSTPVKFPQFNPASGMVTCVRLCITITGVVDTLAIENLSGSPQTATFSYVRNDQISGPGLGSPLSNSITKNYGPYNLAATNGVLGSGPDRVALGHDTVLNTQLCRTISDSTTIAQFYGSDSVTYNYDISVSANASVTGGSSSVLVLTSALVNFHFEYCTCPPVVLPLNISAFNVNKIGTTKAELKWWGYDDPFANYHYEAEVSRNSRNFISVGMVPKNNGTTDVYRMLYDVPNGETGSFYFRIKQVYSNGYVRYSNIKQMVLESSASVKFSLYPNPSSGIVGIKFDNSVSGRFNIQIYNTQGQVLVQKEVQAAGTAPIQIASLSPGVYWLKLTDKRSQESSVSQLLIK